MPRTLLIVESPNKARKIQGFLGRDVVVKASVGHVCDLPQKDYGVDLATLEERYEVRNTRVVGELRKLVKGGGFDRVLLGTDPDREGEAIAWHLARELRLGRGQRVEFREITTAAVRDALGRPRPIDLARVDAQRARRVLDRVVGFDVSSEICWPAGASSAGRVQTPALHILCEREREILAFVPEDYFTLGVTYGEGFDAMLVADATSLAAAAGATRPHDDRGAGDDAGDALGAPAGAATNDATRAGDGRLAALRYATRHEVERARDRAGEHAHVVRSANRRRTMRRPEPPYTTSTLQQDASRKLRLSARQAADQAQALFEAGLITYHRTDSTRVSDDAVRMARERIAAEHPDALSERAPQARVKAGAQDAHEAIRPTRLDDDVQPPKGTERLYALIRARFLASQCRPAAFDRTTILADAGPLTFGADGAVLVEPGFLHYWRPYARQEDRELPAVTAGQQLTPGDYAVDEKRTSPPSRYDTGALIRKLELSGIGRPATFASIIETLLRREYVVETTAGPARGGAASEDDGGTGKPAAVRTRARRTAHASAAVPRSGAARRGGRRVLQPTPLGLRVDGLLTASLPALVGEHYTAAMESSLDRIERRDEGESRPAYLRRWYDDFRATMQAALPRAAAYRAEQGMTGRTRRGVAGGNGDAGAARGEETATRCDRCGTANYRKLTRRKGKGTFLACPSCNLMRDVRARTRPNGCPKCGATLIERRGRRKGMKFWGCVRYGLPDGGCDHAEFTPRAGATGADPATRASTTRAPASPGTHRGRGSGAAGTRPPRSRSTRAPVAVPGAAAPSLAAPAAPARSCPRCAAPALDVVPRGAGSAYVCPAGCGFTIRVGARRRALPCSRCGGMVAELDEGWGCARCGRM